jgi:hypothetical protein
VSDVTQIATEQALEVSWTVDAAIIGLRLNSDHAM